MNDTELIYLAGLFDGEGCIHIASSKYLDHGRKNPQYRLRIQITNTCKNLMDKIGSFGFYVMERKDLKKNWKRCWVGHMYDRKAANLLRNLSPYLIVKKEEAILAIEFQDHKDKVGLTNGKNGLSEEELAYRISIKQQLSRLKEQKI
jgi:hypothetical protein